MVLSTIAIQPSPFLRSCCHRTMSIERELKGPPTKATPSISIQKRHLQKPYTTCDLMQIAYDILRKITYIQTHRIQIENVYRHKIMISIRLNQFRGNLYFLMMLCVVFFFEYEYVSTYVCTRHTIETLIAMMCDTYAAVTA